jgi:hypothetical protein
MNRIIIATAILISLLAQSAWAAQQETRPLTFHDCSLLANYGQIVLVAYCPPAVPPEEVAAFISATKDIWISKYGFVQYRIFSTNNAVPKSMQENMQKSDAWFEKYETGTAVFNTATGAKKFTCKKNQKAELSDCASLIK